MRYFSYTLSFTALFFTYRVHSFLRLKAFCVLKVFQYPGFLSLHLKACALYHAGWILSRLRCNRYSLLDCCLSRTESFRAVPAVILLRTSLILLSCRATNSLHCTLFGKFFFIFGVGRKQLCGSEGSVVFIAHSFWRRSRTTAKTTAAVDDSTTHSTIF